MRRRTAHRLAKLQTRDHVVQGMMLALGRIDEIIKIMKNSADIAAAREALVSDQFGFSPEQVRLFSFGKLLNQTFRRCLSFFSPQMHCCFAHVNKLIFCVPNRRKPS